MEQDQLGDELGSFSRRGMVPVKVERLDEHEYHSQPDGDGTNFFRYSESPLCGLQPSGLSTLSSRSDEKGTRSEMSTKDSRSKKQKNKNKRKRRTEIKRRKKSTILSASKRKRSNEESDSNQEEDPLTLTCTICSKVSKNQRLLKHHMKVVHTEDPQCCDECGKTFKNTELLKVHNRRNHSSKSKSYEKRLIGDRIRKQITRNSAGTNISCVICNLEFPYRGALKNHEETEHKSTDGLTCPKCRRGFTHVEALKYHIRRAHLETVNQAQKVTCDICQLVLKSSRVLKIHLKKVHLNPASTTNATPEVAITAGQNSTSHISNHQSLTGQPEDGSRHHLQCEFCPSKFRKKDLTLHMFQVHERKEFIICGECGKGFSHQINFIQHYKTHSADVWPCQFCDKLFKDQKHQHRHERRTHRKSKSGTYPYDECVRHALQSPAALEKHTRLSHPDRPKNRAPPRPQKESEATVSCERDRYPPFTSLIEQNENHSQEEMPTLARFDAQMEGSSLNENDAFQPQPQPPDDDDWNHAGASDTNSNSGSGPHAEEGDSGEEWSIWEAPNGQSSPSSPITCDTRLTIPHVTIDMCQVTPESQRQAEQQGLRGLDQSQARRPQRPVVEQVVDLEALKQCPKLKMRISVDVKKYTPLPYRKGFHYCDICCLNFLNGKSLGLHIERRHGITYVPKKTTKTIADALKRLRSKYSEDGCVGAQFMKSKPMKSKPKSHATSCIEAEHENLSPAQLAQTSQEPMDVDVAAGPGPSLEPGRGTFSCSLCEKTYDKKRTLRDHQKLLHGDMPQTCYICKTVLANTQYLNRHMRWVHSHNPVMCDICGKEYGSSLKLGMHKRRVHRAQIFTCTICRTDHKTKGSLRQHMRMTHEDDGRRFNCEKCPRTFKRKEYRRRHLEVSHVGQDASFPCDLCGRTFRSARSMEVHKKNHTVEENFRCLFCCAKFNTKKKKTAHENKYHWEEEGYACKICNQKYENGRTLEKHIIYKHSEQELEKLYYEPAKAAPAVPVRNYQQYTHLAVEPLGTTSTSTLSFRPTTTRKERGDPKAWKHLSEEEKRARFKEYYHNPKSCSHCGAVCANRHEIYKHIAAAHPEKSHLRCEKCNLGFFIPKYLHIHNSEVHNAPRPLICSLCGEGFFAPDTYRYHMNKRHGGSRMCDICGMQFPSKAAMQKHQQTYHGHLAAPTNDDA